MHAMDSVLPITSAHSCPPDALVAATCATQGTELASLLCTVRRTVSQKLPRRLQYEVGTGPLIVQYSSAFLVDFYPFLFPPLFFLPLPSPLSLVRTGRLCGLHHLAIPIVEYNSLRKTKLKRKRTYSTQHRAGTHRPAVATRRVSSAHLCCGLHQTNLTLRPLRTASLHVDAPH